MSTRQKRLIASLLVSFFTSANLVSFAAEDKTVADHSSNLATVKKELISKLCTPVKKNDLLKMIAAADAENKKQHFKTSLNLYFEANEAYERSHNPDLEPYEHQLNVALLANYNKLGMYSKLYSRGNTLALKWTEKEKVEEPSLYIELLNILAEADLVEGYLENAKTRLDEAIAFTQRIKISNAISLQTKCLKADLELRTEHYPESEKLYKEVIAAAQGKDASHKEVLAEALDQLARQYNFIGKVKEADDFARKAYALRKELFGEESLQFAESLITKYRISPYTPDALQTLFKALTIQVRCLEGTANPIAGMTMLTIALADSDAPSAESISYCHTAGHAVDGMLAPNCHYYQCYFDWLGSLYVTAGKYKQAYECIEKALQIEKKLLGTRSIASANTLLTLARLKYYDCGDRHDALSEERDTKRVKCPEAEAAIKEAISIYTERLGPEYWQTANALFVYSRIKDGAGEYEEAESLARSGLKILENSFGSDHRRVRYGQQALLATLLDQKKTTEAEGLLADMIKAQMNETGPFNKEMGNLIRRIPKNINPSNPSETDMATLKLLQAMPPEFTGYNKSMALITSQLHADDNSPEGVDAYLQPYKEILAEDERRFGNDSPILELSIMHLAKAYQEKKKYLEAEEQYKRLLSIDEIGLGPDHPNLIKVLEAYGNFLNSIDRKDEGTKMLARAKDIREAAK